MDDDTFSITPEGEMRIKIGRYFGLDEAVRCMRDCPRAPAVLPRRVVFDLLGTCHLQTAGLGYMLMVRERCRLSRESAEILFDHADIGHMLRLARFEEKFHLVPRDGARTVALPRQAGLNIPARNRHGA